MIPPRALGEQHQIANNYHQIAHAGCDAATTVQYDKKQSLKQESELCMGCRRRRPLVSSHWNSPNSYWTPELFQAAGKCFHG
jgi:hypothetical protein